MAQEPLDAGRVTDQGAQFHATTTGWALVHLQPERQTDQFGEANVREVARWLQPALQPNPGFPVPIGGNCWNSQEISALVLGR